MISDQQGKIITSLRHRRSIEAAIREMLEVTSPEELEAMAQRVARRGAEVVPVIVANLSTPDARFRGALGTVARYLDRHEIAFALREVVMQPSRSDQERTTALMILERFLGEEIGEDLYLELADPLEVARQSLREATAEAARDRQSYVDYLRSLEGETMEVATLVLQAAETMEPATVVTPLRLLAQDARATVAQEALRILGMIRLPEAAAALRSLIPCLANGRRGLAERSLRKLTLAGVAVPPPAPLETRCRLLVTPVDGQGTRSVWILEYPGAPQQVSQINLLAVMLDDDQGIADCFGTERLNDMPLSWVPEPGVVHRLSLPHRGFVLDLLEAEAGYPLRLLAEGVDKALAGKDGLPLTLRVWGEVLWQHALSAPQPQRLPELDEARAELLLKRSRRLLAHPAFDSWAPVEPWVHALLNEWRSETPPNGKTAAGIELAQRLTGRYWGPERLEKGRRWLCANSEWFLLAGEREWAELTLAAARGLTIEKRSSHPFLLALAWRALALAWEARERTEVPEHTPAGETASPMSPS